MNGKKIINFGFVNGPVIGLAKVASEKAEDNGSPRPEIELALSTIVIKPHLYVDHPTFGEVAKWQKAYLDKIAADAALDTSEKPFDIWGKDGIEKGAIEQMKVAMRLPIAVKGAMMPDSHLGYGLPIGGVLATNNAVVPYAVGMDISCAMHLSVLDIPLDDLKDDRNFERFRLSLENGTRFGLGASYDRGERQFHPVMDNPKWYDTAFLGGLKDRAYEQLGTSGCSNHFCEYGILTINNKDSPFNLPYGQYVALMSHGGSRKPGTEVCQYYSRIATSKLPDRLSEEFGRLAWLDLDSEPGQEYWQAMNLMGEFALANHEIIHRNVSKLAGAKIISQICNIHNFAWKEMYDGKELIVHRKGATPASVGTNGVIPGSMGAPAFVVRGLGNEKSLNSASHGAGRQLSRTAAKDKFNFKSVVNDLEKKGIHILSAGADESPGAYKSIEKVMADQADLVQPVARFDPKIVKMSGDRDEDYK